MKAKKFTKCIYHGPTQAVGRFGTLTDGDKVTLRESELDYAKQHSPGMFEEGEQTDDYSVEKQVQDDAAPSDVHAQAAHQLAVQESMEVPPTPAPLTEPVQTETELTRPPEEPAAPVPTVDEIAATVPETTPPPVADGGEPKEELPSEAAPAPEPAPRKRKKAEASADDKPRVRKKK